MQWMEGNHWAGPSTWDSVISVPYRKRPLQEIQIPLQLCLTGLKHSNESTLMLTISVTANGITLDPLQPVDERCAVLVCMCTDLFPSIHLALCAQRVTFGKNAISSFRFPLRARALPPIIRARAVMNFSKRGQSERNNERQTLRWCRSSCIIHLPSPSPSVKSWWQCCFGWNSLSKPNRQNQHFYFYMTPPWLENHRPQDKQLLSSPPEAQRLIFKLTERLLAPLKEVFSSNATFKV